MRRASTIVLLFTAVALVLSGCAGIRQRARALDDQMADVTRRAETAEHAAARNASRILDLERRIVDLETSWAILHSEIIELQTGAQPEKDDTP